MKLPRITVFYGWYIVGATFLTGLLSGGFFTFGIGVFFPEVKAEFSLQTHAPLAAIFGIAPLEGAILGPFQGFFVDRFGPRRVMLLGITLNGLGWVLAATSQSLGMFAVFFLLIAAGNGMGLTAPPLATVGNWFIRKRGIAFGIATAGFGLGTVFLPLVNYLIDSLDWRTTAVIIGVVIWAVGYPLALLMRHRPEQYGMKPDGLDEPAPAARRPTTPVPEPDFTPFEALRTRAFWLINLNAASRTFILSALAVNLVVALEGEGFSTATAANVLAAIGVLTVPGRLGTGVLADRIDKRVLAAGISLLMGTSMLLLAWASEVWQLAIFAPVYGLAHGGGGTVMFAMRAEYFGRRSFATISGMGTVMMASGSMLGAWLAAFIFDKTGSYNLAWMTFGAASLVGVAAILLVRRPLTPSRGRGLAWHPQL